MNPEYYLADLPDKNSANSQEKVLNHFGIEHILDNDSSVM